MWMQDIWEGSNPVLNIKHPCSRERDAFRGQSFKLFLLRNLRLAGIRKVLTGGFSWLWNEISSLLKNAPETLGPYLLEPPPRIGLEENLFGICCPFLLFKFWSLKFKITYMAIFFCNFLSLWWLKGVHDILKVIHYTNFMGLLYWNVSAVLGFHVFPPIYQLMSSAWVLFKHI